MHELVLVKGVLGLESADLPDYFDTGGAAVVDVVEDSAPGA